MPSDGTVHRPPHDCVFQGLNGGLIGMMETNRGVPQQESQMHITVLNYLVYKQPIQDSLEGLCCSCQRLHKSLVQLT